MSGEQESSKGFGNGQQGFGKGKDAWECCASQESNIIGASVCQNAGLIFGPLASLLIRYFAGMCHLSVHAVCMTVHIKR